MFVGRLVKEKGFDLILEMCEKIEQEEELRQCVHVDIFGDGALREMVEANLSAWDFVTYHGHQPKEVVFATWKQAHYTLMPSRFLETFGLSALDSLSLGVPVLGPNKGGLQQFLVGGSQMKFPMPACSADRKSDEAYVYVQGLVKDFDLKQWETLSKECKKIAQQYTKEKWLEKFQALSGLQPGARVLLASDYIVDVGGIESYLFNVQSLLEVHGYKVKLVGCTDENKARSRFMQLFGTIRNTKAKRLIEDAVDRFQPDMIWRHSIQRRMGPAPLRGQHHFTGKQRVMYHDFGLFCPYPSKVFSEDELTRGSGLRRFIRLGRTKYEVGGSVGGSRIKKIMYLPLWIAKWCSSFLIKGLLANHIDLHVVPSCYMEQLVQDHYDKEIDLATLAHFA